MRRIFTVGVLLLVGFAAYMASNLIPASGVLLDLPQTLVERCTRVDVFPGTEDVTIDPDTDLAFVSASDRRALAAGKPVRGGIFTVDLASGHAVRAVSPEVPADFQPHGISLWSDPRGDKRLFVVNHPAAGGHTVEIFEVGLRGMLRHLETIAFAAMYTPNDVVAVGPRQFYASNDRGYTSGVMETLEAYLALPLSNVVYFDGREGRVVQKGLAYANGINVSPDGSTVYVAEVLGRRVGFYARNASTGDLERTRLVRIDTGPDNIEIARDGGIWIGGHPRIFDFLKHAEDEAAIAPSHVLRIDPETGDVQDVFIDTAGTINASSVGAVWDRTLVVGAVFDGHVLVCPVPGAAAAPKAQPIAR
jgi:arylesterase/paraoxonase